MDAKALEMLELLRRDGLITSDDAALTPLTGGVSSEIYLIEQGAKTFVVKRALAKLKVQDDWFADVSRNSFEFAFISRLSRFVPLAVPAPILANPAAGYFAMEFLGEGFRNWKRVMLDGECDPAHAARAGELLGTLQKHTWHDASLAREFDTIVNFRQLRIEPYLLTTADRLPEFSPVLREEAAILDASRDCLVHGDYSPKNILLRDDRMVMVDCEVAWFGAATFDPAFLLTHLFLKMLYHAPRDLGGEAMIEAFWKGFVKSRDAGDANIESRVLKLTLMLMLARVHGKSKVEYLDAKKAAIVPRFVREMLASRATDLAIAAAHWNRLIHQEVT